MYKATPDASPTPRGTRIARISTVPFFMATQLKKQIETLSACGARVTVVTSEGPESGLLKTIPGIELVQIDMPRSIAPYRDARALLYLWRLFRRERIQIAHSTTPKAGLLVAIAAYLAKVPIRLHTFTGQPWIGLRGVKHWLARSGDWLIGRLNTHCYADSASQRQFLIDQGVLQSGRITVLGDGSLAGVDTARFDHNRFPADQRREIKQALGIPATVPVLLFVGRITPDKGVGELLEAFAWLKADGSCAHLLLVGPLDPDSGAGGSISAHALDAVRDVHYVGYSEQPERYMAIADILCLPSYREGFGTVVIEAAAMGLPSVGTSIYGLTDAVEDGVSGILVAPKSALHLKEALARLLEDEPLRHKMGVAARQRAQERFSADKVNAGVVAEYNRLLQLADKK